jgi:signal transduction histidine kinase
MDDDQKIPDISLFLASAAHDMKNSVGMLSGTLESLLTDETIKSAPAYQQLTHMLYETKRLNDNLIHLLALYKEVGTASYPFDPQPQSIADFIEEIIGLNRVLFEAKSIAFETDFPDDLVWCFDEDLIVGVVGNALNNAIRYTQGKIRLAIAQVDDILEIRVEDDGRGYPPSMLLSSTTIKSGVDFATGSTGLGLHFSSEVARMHRHRGRVGSIALENGGLWNGGCFVLRLP